MQRYLSCVIIILSMTILAANAQTPFYFGWSGVTPQAADYDGDRIQELALYNSTAGTICVRRLNGEDLAFGMTIAQSGFAAAQADYDGDGLTDLGSYDRTNGVWYAYCSASSYQLSVFPCVSGPSTTTPEPADYDGDGKADLALYDSYSGAWIIYPSVTGYQQVSFVLGGNGAVAVPADYDADGKADPAVYDHETGLWGVLCSASQYAYTWVVYGGPGCEAAPADFDGDRKTDPAVYSAALGVWGTLYSSSNYAPGITIQGGPDCVPVPGKYYFTNCAEFAVYAPEAGSWHIAYESPLTIHPNVWLNLCSSVLPRLVKGAAQGAFSGAISWGLKLLFEHGQNPDDPHWDEMRTILSEMNGKLDELLVLSISILTQLNELARQLAYDSAQTRILISQLMANQAFVTIASLYDSWGPEGYRTFYTCDTNHPPSDKEVVVFVNKVLQSNLPGCILTIKQAILPILETERGVLRQWVDMAKLKGVTSDNLPDHYQAFFAYFSTLYSYQVKAAALYVDACRQAYTSEFQNAATYAWITNDFMKTLEAEVEEFRGSSYDLVLAAIDATYDPVSASNQLANVTNVAATLSTLEFFARQWLVQTQTLSTTFLTVNRPDVLIKYNGLKARSAVDHGFLQPALVVASNYVYARPYGFKNPDIKNIGVSDRYVFLRNDFGQVPPDTYVVYNEYFQTGEIPVTNYDDNMTPTNDPSVTNFFGHLYDSPFNYEQLALPMDSADWWNNRYENATYSGANPGHTGISYTPSSRCSANGISMIMDLVYNLKYTAKLPSFFGVQPWVFALGYPFAVSNQTSRALNVRAYLATDHCSTYISCQRWDSGSASSYTYAKKRHDQNWGFGGGGFMSFANGTTTKWLENSRQMTHPAGSVKRTGYDKRWPIRNEMAACTVQPMQNGQLLLYVGGEMYLYQNCYRKRHGSDPIPVWSAPIHAWGWVTFNIQRVMISFY